ncbi:hypothetical protein DFH94DRAFT_684420 [Russula ochroleuca]|uniref:Uncharacterized protein n=1 Tax=Russula ochroleuca TaxID=152965 RepID=A0A9P5JYY9_9AGAM|nr:hypothetical protein DFH94DRAFT_684420 [Russula ochroleuca]
MSDQSASMRHQVLASIPKAPIASASASAHSAYRQCQLVCPWEQRGEGGRGGGLGAGGRRGKGEENGPEKCRNPQDRRSGDWTSLVVLGKTAETVSQRFRTPNDSSAYVKVCPVAALGWITMTSGYPVCWLQTQVQLWVAGSQKTQRSTPILTYIPNHSPSTRMVNLHRLRIAAKEDAYHQHPLFVEIKTSRIGYSIRYTIFRFLPECVNRDSVGIAHEDNPKSETGVSG